MKVIRAAVLALFVASLVPMAGPSAAVAKGHKAGASAKRVANTCAKRASRRTAAWRRCVAGGAQRAPRDTTASAAPKSGSSPARPRQTPPPTAGGDTTAPTVSWDVPTAAATVSGRIQGAACEALASDNRGVDRVVMTVDGSALNTESDAPWNCIFDSRQVGDGVHTLTATAYDAAGNSRTATTVVNVENLPDQAPEPTTAPESSPAPIPAPSTGPLVLGIDGGYAGWSDSEISQRAALGAAVTRHEWDPLDPVEEQDEEVEIAAAEIHTRIHALLGGNELGDANHYRDFVIAFVGRYGVGGSFWAEHPELDASRYAITTIELGNEPYFGEMSPEEYAAAVRPTLEEIKDRGLPVKVVLPQRVYGSDTSWMDTLYARIPDLNSLFYAFAEHPYWYAHDPAQVHAAGPFGRIDRVRQRMNEKGAADKPIFITEYGESTADCGGECVGEEVQAEHLQSMLNAATSRTYWRVEMFSVFQLVDRGTASSDRELQFGLLRQDGSRKPSYPIVRGLIQQYRG